jgi:hypothetical protein
MKKSILVLGLSLALLGISGSDVLSQASKEISEPITLSWYSTSKVLPVGEDRNFVTIEVFGVIICDEGKGLFHEATVRGLGSTLREKGVMQNYVLYASWLLKTGDKVFITLTAEGKTGVPTKGKATIIGGTGKCAGIQGSWEYTGYSLRPAMEGIGQGYNKHLIKYKLPQGKYLRHPYE